MAYIKNETKQVVYQSSSKEKTPAIFMPMEDKVITEAEYKEIVNKDMGKQYGTGK